MSIYSSELYWKEVGDLWKEEISVSAGSTETHDLSFPAPEASLIYIAIAAESGTTDCDLSIHESTDYDLTDQIFRATGISINDNTPTGGRPSTGSIPYGEENGNSTIHIKTVENSGNDGTLLLKIRYLEV